MTWTDREGPLHRSILAHLRRLFPAAVIHHSPNGSSLKGPEVARQIAKAKSLGMVKGFPDLVVFHEGEALFFEVKAEGGKTQPEQNEVLAQLKAQGFRAAVVRSLQDVDECLDHWQIEPWQSIGCVSARLLNETARKRGNAAGPDHNPEIGETGMALTHAITGKAGEQ